MEGAYQHLDRYFVGLWGGYRESEEEGMVELQLLQVVAEFGELARFLLSAPWKIIDCHSGA